MYMCIYRDLGPDTVGTVTQSISLLEKRIVPIVPFGTVVMDTR